MENGINLKTAIKGATMGIAEVIPGVSGGTIAFITGIYFTLLDSIKAFDVDLLKLLLKGEFKQVWAKINGGFLTNLLVGMGIGILIGIFAITWFLKNYPEPLWGFFFGLIIVSAYIIGNQVKPFKPVYFVFLILGAIIAFVIVNFSPVEGSTAPWYIFICGAIAICAMILPGISGSFMLLVLGLYTLVIGSLKNVLTSFDLESLKIVIIFALGCIVGLALFSRVLSWFFHHYKEQTLVLMTGFLIGSLYKVWPWRNIAMIQDKTTGVNQSISNKAQYDQNVLENMKILKESNVFPNEYWVSDPHTLVTIFSIFAGGFILWFLESKLSRSSEGGN